MSVLWKAPSNITGSPIYGGGAVWTLDQGAGVVYGLSRTTGKVLRQVDVGPTSRFATMAMRARLPARADPARHRGRAYRLTGWGYPRSPTSPELPVLAKPMWSILGGVSAALAGLVAQKSLELTWRKATGKEPPANPESPETTWVEAVGFSVLSGVLIGVARLLARRSAARSWVKATGNLPPGLETVT